MPSVEEGQLRKQIAGGELQGLFVVAGEEKYLVRRLAQQLRKKAGGESFPEFNQQDFTNDSSLDSIADAAQALPFFAQRKCVAVADFDVESKSAQELDKLYELWELSPETTTLVFWYPTLLFDGKKSAKWRKFLKNAEKQGTVVFCQRRSASELQRMLLREAEKNGCVLSRQNAERLVEYAGPDVTALRQEMEKLCAFALGSGQGEITGEMVETMVSKTTETTVFLMANALVAGEYEKAYGLLEQLFAQNEEPLSILGALSASYVDMVRVRAALESGGTAQDAARYGDYKGREFRLRNAQRAARNLTQGALRKSLHLLLEADLALKGSRLDGRIILDELVAKLLLASREEPV